MALSRPRRSNAGSKMASLLNSMEADDFYTTTYGGFVEDDVDDDFVCEAVPGTGAVAADVDDDIVDSDFSIDENDEPRSDVENSDDPDRPKKLKRGQGVQTKAYKEPKRDQAKPKRAVTTATVATPSVPPVKVEKVSKPQKFSKMSNSDFGRKYTRASTVSKTVETVKRQKERALKAKKLLKKKIARNKIQANANRQLTQEELLEEAKETELLNIESLKKFQQMEIEAKQQAMRASKRTVEGSYIQYRSTTMPLHQISPKKNLNHSGIGTEDKICVDDMDDSKEDDEKAAEEEINEEDKEERQERTFLTFSDFDTFRRNFPQRKPRETQQKICPITRLPAKYFDPVTKLPYANLQAFRILREAYYSQLELKGDKNDPEVAAWLEWRLKNKPSKPPILTQITRPPAAFSHLLANATPVPSPIRAVAAAVTSSTPLTPTAGISSLPPVMRHPTTTIVMTTTAPPTIIQTARTIVASQQPIQQQQQQQHQMQQQQQQSIVLPVRTTPLTQSPIPVTQLLQTSATSLGHGPPNFPTQPTATGIQTVKIGGQTQVSLTGLTRTITSTSLTAQQIQHLAASRGATSMAAFQNALRGTGMPNAQRSQLIARPSIATTVSPSAMLRPQNVAGQVTLQQPQTRPHTIALQRPGMTTQTIALQPAGGVRAGQFLVAPGGTSGTRQQIVVASSGHGGVSRQIVMTTQGGGTPVRPGQILQVTSQGGQQHQIVVSQSGQIILNPQTAKPAQQQQ